MKIFCINCNKDIEAVLTSGKEIYTHRTDLYNLKFYKCPICKNYVGCHKGTDKPLGCIPTKQLKQARMKAHNKSIINNNKQNLENAIIYLFLLIIIYFYLF